MTADWFEDHLLTIEAADIVRGLAQLLRSAAPFKQLQKEDES